MTADRLREAAGWLQSEADWVRTLGLSWQREAAMAALLRAVADEHETFAEWVGPVVMKDYDSATFNVALALADVILGGSDVRA